MTSLPYVRLRPDDLPRNAAIWGWTLASPQTLSAVGLGPGRVLPVPLAGHRTEEGKDLRRPAREGLTSLLALEPSHRDRTLYLEVVHHFFPGFERWLERRVARAFTNGRYAGALREAVALVNLFPGRAEPRFNLGLLLTRMVSQDPQGGGARRWAALARGEFARAAHLSPELFWGYYHRGVLAFEASLEDAAGQDWLVFLDRYFGDKPAPKTFQLPLEPFPLDDEGHESAELPGLAYTVLLDFLGLARTPASAPAVPAPPVNVAAAEPIARPPHPS